MLPLRGASFRTFATLLCVLAAFGIGSCRELPTPAASTAPGPDPLPSTGERLASTEVPQFRRVKFDQVGKDLRVQFAVDRPRADAVQYDPMRPGGWSFQMFLDTDQQPTGYWHGYDYLTRDTESDLGDRALRVRRTIALAEPSADGWGEETAVVPVHANSSILTFRVPLAAVADQDGRIDFALEVYRTTACSECPSGRSYDYAYGLFGTSDTHGRSLEVRRVGREGRPGHFARERGTVAAR